MEILPGSDEEEGPELSDAKSEDMEDIPFGHAGPEGLQAQFSEFFKQQRIRDLRLSAQQKVLAGTLAALVEHLKSGTCNTPSSGSPSARSPHR